MVKRLPCVCVERAGVPASCNARCNACCAGPMRCLLTKRVPERSEETKQAKLSCKYTASLFTEPNTQPAVFKKTITVSSPKDRWSAPRSASAKRLCLQAAMNNAMHVAVALAVAWENGLHSLHCPWITVVVWFLGSHNPSGLT